MNCNQPLSAGMGCLGAREPSSKEHDKQPQLDPDTQQQHSPAWRPHLRSPALCQRGSVTTWSGQMPYTSL